MRRPRILLACDWFVRYTVGLANGLADHDAEVRLLTRSHDREFGSAPGAMREYVSAALQPGVAHVGLGRRVRDPRAAAEIARVRSAVARLGPDVVHVQDSVLNDPRLLVAARARPGRYALTVHDLDVHPGDPRMTASQRVLWRALVGGAGLIFVHAETLRERLLAEHAPRGAVAVVPVGADEPSVSPLPEAPMLLLFGRISAYKGIDTLLDAMPLVWERAPQTRLTIAGSGRIERHPALDDERVLLRNRFIPDADVPALFAAATCVVLPYREASQSAVAAQAKHHGRPIIATNVGGLPEAARHGGARLVPPEDPRALADAVLEIVRTPGLAERLSRAATAAARAQSWSQVGAATLEAYERHLLRPVRTAA